MSTKIDRILVWVTTALFLLVSFCIVQFSTEEVQTIDIQGHPTLGSARAPVKIVIFEDLKCVWCAHFSREVFPKLQRNYIDTGKARYTIVLLSFLKGSKPAGNAALEVFYQNPKLFFPFVETIYEEQPPEEENWATEETMKEFAATVPGINVPKMVQSMKKGSYNEVLEGNFKLAKEVMKEQIGTPTIYINGVRIEELDYESISKYIDEALHD